MAPTVARIEPWKAQAAPMAWRGDRIFYHRTGQGVVAEGYSCLPDGSDERLETGSVAYPNGTHQGVEDVSPECRYGLITVERANRREWTLWLQPVGFQGAAPGAGAYNDLWLLDRQTGQTWKLIDLLVTGNAALIWPRFNPAGNKITWAELWQPDVGGFTIGKWTLFVADLVFSNGVPQFVNRRAWKTQAFVEPYGFLPDGSVLVTTSAIPGVSYWNAQICKVPVTPSGFGTPVRLSTQKTPDESQWWAVWQNYCEFAYEMPAFPDRIMYGRMFGATGGSIEFWTMKQDGTDHQRLTYFCDPDSPQFQGQTCILGGIGWDPDNPLRFVVGIGLDLNNNFGSAMVELAA